MCLWSLSPAVELPTDSLGVMNGCPVPLHFLMVNAMSDQFLAGMSNVFLKKTVNSVRSPEKYDAMSFKCFSKLIFLSKKSIASYTKLMHFCLRFAVLFVVWDLPRRVVFWISTCPTIFAHYTTPRWPGFTYLPNPHRPSTPKAPRLPRAAVHQSCAGPAQRIVVAR